MHTELPNEIKYLVLSYAYRLIDSLIKFIDCTKMNKNSNEMLDKIMQVIGRRRIHASISYNTPLNNSNKTIYDKLKTCVTYY